jgi:hypothetical protein
LSAIAASPRLQQQQQQHSIAIMIHQNLHTDRKTLDNKNSAPL